MIPHIQARILTTVINSEKKFQEVLDEIEWTHSYESLHRHMGNLLKEGLITHRHEMCYTNNKGNMTKMNFYNITEKGKRALIEVFRLYEVLWNKAYSKETK